MTQTNTVGWEFKIKKGNRLTLFLLILGVFVVTTVSAAKRYGLHEAVANADLVQVRTLLHKGADINQLGPRRYGNGSALHLAVREGHLEIARLLIDRGAEVDVLDTKDFTPLHNAAWNGNLDMTELLLDAGADINASTYDGDTPLKLAQNNDHAQVAEFIQVRLQASSSVATRAESAPASDTGAIDISGTYISEITYPENGSEPTVRFIKKKNRKEITLEQTGNAISGFDGTKDPKIIGTRDGNTIDFYILLPDQIYGNWEINADGTEIVGKWSVGGRGLYGTWKLTKIESDTAPVIDISGTYISEITYPRHGTPDTVRFVKKKNRKEITLEQTGNAISFFDSTKDPKIIGTRDANTINFYVPLTEQIYGTWEINADGTEIVGKWSVGGRGLYGTWNLTKID